MPPSKEVSLVCEKIPPAPRERREVYSKLRGMLLLNKYRWSRYVEIDALKVCQTLLRSSSPLFNGTQKTAPGTTLADTLTWTKLYPKYYEPRGHSRTRRDKRYEGPALIEEPQYRTRYQKPAYTHREFLFSIEDVVIGVHPRFTNEGVLPVTASVKISTPRLVRTGNIEQQQNSEMSSCLTCFKVSLYWTFTNVRRRA